MTTFANPWTAAFEATPADNSNINLGASYIRDLKVEIRERLAIDHSWQGDTNDGLHLQAELVPRASTPVPVNATDGVVYSRTVAGVAELHYRDSSGHALRLTNAGAYNITSLALSGTLSVVGMTTLAGLTVGNAANITGTLGVASRATFATSIQVNGSLFFGTSGNTSISWNATHIFINVNGITVAQFPP